ncbi:dynein regulatory complex subunit 3 [Odontesthes bonariensis]
MNEKILREAVIKQVTQEQIRQIPKADRIHFNEALDLRLGHKNILKIDLLTEFTSLVKLNLNNNLIQEIQGLGSLVNQKWLRKNNFLILHFVAGTGEKTRTKYKKMSPQSVRGNDSDIFVCVFWICHLTGSRKSRVWSLWASLMCLMCWMCWICPTTKSLSLDAFVEFLNGSCLFDSMFTDDPEAQRLHCVLGSTMELQQLSDPHAFEVKINQHNDEITQFYESLLALEFELDSKLEFAQSRDLEDNCYQKMQEIAIAFLERVAKENLEEDMPHDVLMLFTDKNAVMDTLATSHDSHLLRISDRENQLVTRVSNWKVSLTKEIQEKGFQQNRKRISDIKRYVDHLRRQLNGVL